MVQSLKITRRLALASLAKAGGAMGLFGFALLGGCAGEHAWQRGETSPTGTVGIQIAPARPLASPARSALPIETPASPSGIQLPYGEESPTGGLSQALDQVRCRGAMSAVLAQLTEMERGLAAEFFNGSRCVSANMKCLQQELLMFRTLTLGNDAASQALKVYLQLAEAEAQSPILEASLAEIQSMRDDLAELKRRELPVDMEPGPLDRQYLSTSEQQSSLKAGMAQARTQLTVLLGEEGSAPAIGNLEDDVTLAMGIPDRDHAVQVALEMRPELRTLRTMLGRLDAQTLPMARAVLQQYEGSLGTVQPTGIGVTFQQLFSCIPCFGPAHCPLPSQVREVEVRTLQLSELLRKREEAIIAEVDAALFAMESALEKRNSARQRVESWKDELDRLTRKQAVDEKITAFDLAKARLGILQARAELVTLSVDCLEAQVQLWTAQDVTGAGCGLPGHDSAWCQIEPSNQPTPAKDPTMPPLAPAPKIVPMSGNFRPSALPVTPFQSCRPANKSAW